MVILSGTARRAIALFISQYSAVTTSDFVFTCEVVAHPHCASTAAYSVERSQVD